VKQRRKNELTADELEPLLGPADVADCLGRIAGVGKRSCEAEDAPHCCRQSGSVAPLPPDPSQALQQRLVVRPELASQW
jgi:hypothetical protein